MPYYVHQSREHMNKSFKQALIVGPIAGAIALVTVGTIAVKQEQAKQHSAMCRDYANRIHFLNSVSNDNLEMGLYSEAVSKGCSNL